MFLMLPGGFDLDITIPSEYKDVLDLATMLLGQVRKARTAHHVGMRYPITILTVHGTRGQQDDFFAICGDLWEAAAAFDVYYEITDPESELPTGYYETTVKFPNGEVLLVTHRQEKSPGQITTEEINKDPEEVRRLWKSIEEAKQGKRSPYKEQ